MTESLVCADVQHRELRRLAGAVILQTLRDLIAPDPVRALDAALFLTGSDFGIWADAAGVPFADGARLLTVGNATSAAAQATRLRGFTRGTLPALVER